MLSALRSPSFALAWLGQTASLFGDAAFAVALPWQVLLLTGSGTAMGAVLVARTVPRLVFLGAGGVLADRLSRRNIMLWSDAGRAGVMILIAWLSWTNLIQLWQVTVLSIIFGVFDGFFMPASHAILPQLVNRHALSSANMLNSLSEQASELVGPLLGAGLIALGGPFSAFAFDALSFAISAVLILQITDTAVSLRSIDDRSCSTKGGQGARDTELRNFQQLSRAATQFFVEARDGLIYAIRTPWLWISIVVAAGANAAFVGSSVALPFLVRDQYGGDAWLLGTLFAAQATGAIFGMLVVGWMGRVSKRGLLAYSALVLSSIALAAYGFPWPHSWAPIVTSLLSFAVGCGLSTFGVLWATVMQERVPEDRLGRVTSIDYVGSYSLVPVSYLLAGALTESSGAPMVFVSFGLWGLLLSAVAVATPHIRQLD